MKTADLPPKRLAELIDANERGKPAGRVPVYGADLRALLAMRAELQALRRAADPFADGARADLVAKAKAATVSSSQVFVPIADLRALLAMRAELQAYRVEAERFEQAEREALAKAGARVVKVRSVDSKPRSTIVGPDHGKGRTYGFDLHQLAGFLDLHDETVRKAIRTGELIPTDLASIHAYRLRLDARRSKDTT